MRSLLRLSWLLMIIVLLGASVSRVLAASYTVTIDETKFVPSTLKVKTGDSITFINTADSTQSAKTTSSAGFNTGNIGPGSSKSVTVNTEGTYTYTSAFNSALQGTVTVEGATSLTATPTSTLSATTTKGGDPMPVSGTAEVLMALLAGGFGLIAFGVFTNRVGSVGLSHNNPVLEVPPVSSYNEPGEHE
jgi:plastocyanin